GWRGILAAVDGFLVAWLLVALDPVQQRAMLKKELAHIIYIHMLSCLNKWR
uniref:Uncharacterized protein n=1 Tax=Triticum urartu TaxID=4572 RepID=A0A8R7QUV3_TRIUA